MKIAGYVMITIGFLSGALVAVLEVLDVEWAYFLPAFIVGVVGIALVRLSTRRQIRSQGRLASSIQNIEASLGRIVENMHKLNSEKDSLEPYGVRHRIDELFRSDLDAFAEARESISHAHGLQAYADVMSYFAAGERYLNRVWSASADGYIDEIRTFLEKAAEQFQEALQRLQKLER